MEADVRDEPPKPKPQDVRRAEEEPPRPIRRKAPRLRERLGAVLQRVEPFPSQD
jgi:hypothetical protein